MLFCLENQAKGHIQTGRKASKPTWPRRFARQSLTEPLQNLHVKYVNVLLQASLIKIWDNFATLLVGGGSSSAELDSPTESSKHYIAGIKNFQLRQDKLCLLKISAHFFP